MICNEVRNHRFQVSHVDAEVTKYNCEKFKFSYLGGG